MTLEEIKTLLSTSETIAFRLPTRQKVPAHFHVTEVGKVTKDFIDCGGKRRQEQKASFQLWEENDYDHRLHPEKLANIIELSQKTLGLADEEIEVEYQGETIGKYGLEHNGKEFVLTTTKTTCLAKDNCGIPETKVDLTTMIAGQDCKPDSGCC